LSGRFVFAKAGGRGKTARGYASGLFSPMREASVQAPADALG
jgi:hypothetical protein